MIAKRYLILTACQVLSTLLILAPLTLTADPVRQVLSSSTFYRWRNSGKQWWSKSPSVPQVVSGSKPKSWDLNSGSLTAASWPLRYSVALYFGSSQQLDSCPLRPTLLLHRSFSKWAELRGQHLSSSSCCLSACLGDPSPHSQFRLPSWNMALLSKSTNAPACSDSYLVFTAFLGSLQSWGGFGEDGGTPLWSQGPGELLYFFQGKDSMGDLFLLPRGFAVF